MRVLKALFTLVALAATMFLIAYCSFAAGMYVGEFPGSVWVYLLIYTVPSIFVGVWFYRAGVTMGKASCADRIADITTVLDEYDEVLNEFTEELSCLEDENTTLRAGLTDANAELEFAYAQIEEAQKPSGPVKGLKLPAPRKAGK